MWVDEISEWYSISYTQSAVEHVMALLLGVASHDYRHDTDSRSQSVMDRRPRRGMVTCVFVLGSFVSG